MDEKTEAPQVASRTFPPCTDLSLEARAFMNRSSGATWMTVDLSPEGVSELRTDNSAVASVAWGVVKQEGSVIFSDEVVDGVPCQWVAPLEEKGNEVVLYVFGGAFVVGSPDDDRSVTARIARYMGRRVCVPNYRLAPEHPFPAGRDDIMAVYQTLVKKYDVFVVGQSAGGNLALGLVLRLFEAAERCLPVAVALLSPWIDLTHSGDSHAILSDLDPTLSVKHFLEPASLVYAGKRPRSSPDISPLFAVIPANFPPTVISTAGRDLLLSDSIRIAKKLRAKNCKVDLRIAEGLWHVYEWYPECPEAAESLQGIANFLLNCAKSDG